MDKKPGLKNKAEMLFFLFWPSLFLIGFGAIYMGAAGEIINYNNLVAYSNRIHEYGLLGPFLYILLCILACLIFLPSIPLYLLGGFVFGPWWSLLYTTLGSNLGGVLAFFLARYTARAKIEKWILDKDPLQRLDHEVKKQGWRMLMVTRLVPVIPFNLQNYAYGLTQISPATYTIFSLVFRLPLIMALSFTGGSVLIGQEDIRKTWLYLAVAGIIMILLVLFYYRLNKNLNIKKTREGDGDGDGDGDDQF